MTDWWFIIQSWRLYEIRQPPTCLCKEVGGYLTRCPCIAVSITLNDESSVSHSVTYVCIELLWQLKRVSDPFLLDLSYFFFERDSSRDSKTPRNSIFWKAHIGVYTSRKKTIINYMSALWLLAVQIHKLKPFGNWGDGYMPHWAKEECFWTNHWWDVIYPKHLVTLILHWHILFLFMLNVIFLFPPSLRRPSGFSEC